MKNQVKIAILTILLIYSVAYGQITLDSCQQKAKNNYPLISQYDLIEKSTEYNLSNAGKAYLPQLSVTGIAGKIDGMPEMTLPGQTSETNDYNLIGMVQLNQNIWDGGITSSNKDIITAESGIEKADLEVKFHELEKRVNGIYFGILLIDEQTNQLKVLISNLERNKKNVQTAIENGIAYKTDLEELQVEILKTEQSLSELKYNRDAYVKMLSLLIGEEVKDLTKLERPTVKEEVGQLSILRPELSLFEKQKKLVAAKYSMSKTSLYPKIGLMGFGMFLNPGIKFGTSEVTRVLVGGLSLSWELGGLYKNSNNSDITQVSQKKIEAQQETFLFNTNLELSQKEKEIAKYKSQIEKDKEILELKRNIKTAYETKYNNGVATMSNLLDRINDENVSFLNLIKDEISYLMMVYQYKNISGN